MLAQTHLIRCRMHRMVVHNCNWRIGIGLWVCCGNQTVCQCQSVTHTSDKHRPVSPTIIIIVKKSYNARTWWNYTETCQHHGHKHHHEKASQQSAINYSSRSNGYRWQSILVTSQMLRARSKCNLNNNNNDNSPTKATDQGRQSMESQ